MPAHAQGPHAILADEHRPEGLMSVYGFLAVQPGGSLPPATPRIFETWRQLESVGGPRNEELRPTLL